MPGTWTISALPKRGGAYFNFKGQPQTLVPPAVGSVVAVPFVHSWGPENLPVTLNSFSDFSSIYGDDLGSAGWRAVRQGFVGEAVRGRRGAGAVVGYRLVGSAGALATVSLSNTTPAAALRVDALYKGTRGNALRVTIQTDPADGTKRDLVVLDGLTILETWPYTPADLAGLAASVNGKSNWVKLTVLIDGVALTPVAAVPLAAGNDGSTLVAGDWTTMMTALEAQRFGYLAPYDLTDSSIVASLTAWAKNANAKGRRFFTVVGGALNELVATAVARAATMNDPDMVTIGVGSIQDNVMLDANGNPVVLSTSQFVPRLAGIMAALGETRSLSGARVGGVDLLNGANEASIDLAFDGGVIVLARDSDPDAPIRVEKGLTTYTTKSNKDVPYAIFKTPKYVRTMHDLQDEITAYVASNVQGQLTVDSKARSHMVGYVSALLQTREDNRAVQHGWSVGVSSNPPPSDDDEFIALDVALAFGRSAEQVLLNVTVR